MASETKRLSESLLKNIEDEARAWEARRHVMIANIGDVLALVAEVRHFRDMHARAAADAQAASEPAAFRGSVAEFLESIGEAVPSVVANNPSSLGGDVRVVELRGGVESLKLTEDEIEALRLARRIVGEARVKEAGRQYLRGEDSPSEMSAALRALDKAIALVGGGAG